MRILVTGAVGTLGTPLVAELRARKHTVVGTDIRHGSDPDTHRCDVAEYRQLRRLFVEQGPFDHVFNLAAEFGRRNGDEFYESLWRTNATGMENVLQLQNEFGFKLIHMSSSEVYGEGPFAGLECDPVSKAKAVLAETVRLHSETSIEDGMNLFPRVQHNSYAISKWVNEAQCLNAARRHGQQIIRIRPFCSYGPGEYYSPYRSVCCKFVYSLLHEQPITVHTDHARVFLYIDDIIPTLANAVENFIPGEVYNIGGSDPTNIGGLADIVADTLGLTRTQRSELVRVVPREDFNTLEKVPDITKARRDLGHNPQWGIEEGILETVGWQRKIYATTATAGQTGGKA